MSSSKFAVRGGVMPALDVNSLDQMTRVIEATCKIPGIAGYKLGLTTVLRTGLAAAMRMARESTDLPIVYDHQKVGPDMPDMAGKFAEICREAGTDGLIMFPVAGPTAVREFAGRALDAGIIPIVGGEIPVKDYTLSGGGFMADDALDRIMEVAAEVGTTHFVLPANNPETIRRRSHWMATKIKNPVVFLTGIGPLGGKIEEAFGAATEVPHRLAIIGRLITAAKDPKDAARRCVDAIMNVA